MPCLHLFFDQTLEVKIGKWRLLSNSGHFPALFAERVQFRFIEWLLAFKVAGDLFIFPLESLFDVNHGRTNRLRLWFTWRNESVLHTGLLSLFTNSYLQNYPVPN